MNKFGLTILSGRRHLGSALSLLCAVLIADPSTVLGYHYGPQTGSQPNCYNPPANVTPSCKECGVITPCPPTSNPVNVASGDVQRNVVDLKVFGGAGEHQLNWTRYGHSRLATGARPFGEGHIWRHSYQFEMISEGVGQLRITLPEGDTLRYTLNNGVWTGIASNPNLLSQDGTNFYLRKADGFTYHFVSFVVSGQTVYQMQDFTVRWTPEIGPEVKL